MIFFLKYGRYLFQRVFFTILTLIGLMALVFLMTKIIPGDEARMAAGPEATEAQIEIIRQRMGLDASIPIQFLRFVGQYAQGNLGTSITTLQPVLTDLLKVLPSTIELVLSAMSLCLLISIPAAAFAAARRDGVTDITTRVIAVTLGGLPTFWLALMLQYLIATRFRLLPISGQQSFQYLSDQFTGMPVLDSLLFGIPNAFVDALSYLFLPSISLSALFISQMFRMLRTTLLSILEADFISAVRAKGASPVRIMVRHALPNSFGILVTLVGTQFGLMLGSAVLVEGIFARPGMGSYLANAVAQKDMNAVLGSVFFVGATVCIVNLLADFVHLMVDSRVRAAHFNGVHP